MKAGLILCGLLVFAALGLAFFAPKQESKAVSTPAVPTAAPAQAVPEKRQARITELAGGMNNPAYSAGARLGRAELLVREFPDAAEAAQALVVIKQLKAEIEEAKVGAQWTYTTFDDSMSGKQGASAYVRSTNSFEFGFPYQGRQHATLAIRQHPRWGKDVIFSIEKGQILCGISDCPVRVRFDDGKTRTLSANEPADHSSESIFLPAASFTKQLQVAKIVRVEVNMYHEGVLMAEFDVSGFKPERLSASTGSKK